jgi:WD40 repeat protein
MRRSAIVLLFAVLLLSARLHAADAPEEADQPETETLTPEKLGKLSLTVEAGGHLATIHRVLFTHDGKELLTVAADHTIRFWDVRTGEARRVLRPPGSGSLDDVALSPDGKLLAVATSAHEGGDVIPIICVIRYADGQLDRPALEGTSGCVIKALAFSPDGNWLASGSDDQAVLLWNLERGESSVLVRATERHPLAFAAVAFSPDGRRLARVGHANVGAIIDLKAGKAGRVTELKIAPKHSFRAVAWADDGQKLATFSPKDGVRLWKPDGKLLQHVPVPDLALRSATFSPFLDRLLVTWKDKQDNHHATLFELPTDQTVLEAKPARERVHFSPRGSSRVWCGALSDDGKLAATAGGGSGMHETFLWRTADGDQVHPPLTAPRWLGLKTAAGWSADGQAVCWDNRSLNLDKLTLGSVKAATDGPVRKLGTLSLQTNRLQPLTARVTEGGKLVATLTLPDGSKHQGLLSATLLGSDRAVLTDNKHPELWLFDLGPGTADEPRKPVRHLDGHAAPAWSVVPRADNRYLLSVSSDQTLRLWSPKQDKALLALYVQGEDWIVWTPQGGYYAATPGGEKLIGWTLDRGLKEMPAVYTAERFHKLLYRPELIQAIFEKGSVEEALKASKDRGAVEIDDVLPPKVEIKDVKKVAGGVQITATATAGAGREPVQSLRLLLDGRPLAGAKAWDFGAGQKTAEAEWTVAGLPGGHHELKVLARCTDVSGISSVYRLDAPLPDKDRPLLYRVCVGINEYEQSGLHLGSATLDAEAVFKALDEDCTGKGNRFRAADGVKLLDKKATRDAVLQALKDVRKAKVKPGDLVVVFFAGHGVVQNGEFFLLTWEADPGKPLKDKSLSGEDLRTAFGEMPCSVLLLMDACHSAAGVKGLKPATDDLTRSLTDDRWAVTVMAAAMGHETAAEQKDHGLFTKALLDGLKAKTGVAFDPYDHQMYVHHLYSYVFSEVRQKSAGRQNPFLNMPWTVPPLAIRQLPAQ